MESVEKKELTPCEQLKEQLQYSIRQYRIAVRWLRDARAYLRVYSGDLTFEGKSWKDSVEGELATDSDKAYKEAAAGVLYWRKRINYLNNALMELGSKDKNNERRP